MAYRASDYPPFAVTVDLVVLTVRDDALQALARTPGERALRGSLGAARRVRPGRRGPRRGRRAGAGRGDRAAADRRTSGAARDLRRPAPRPSDAGRLGRPPRARRRPAHAGGRQRRRRCPLAAGRRSARRQPSAGLRPRPDPARRGGAGPGQAGVHAAGDGVLRRASSPSRELRGSTRRSGGSRSTRATSTARSPARPASWSRPARPRLGRAGGRPSSTGWATRRCCCRRCCAADREQEWEGMHRLSSGLDQT